MEKYLLFYIWLLHYNSKKDDGSVVHSLWIHTRTGCHQESPEIKRKIGNHKGLKNSPKQTGVHPKRMDSLFFKGWNLRENQPFFKANFLAHLNEITANLGAACTNTSQAAHRRARRGRASWNIFLLSSPQQLTGRSACGIFISLRDDLLLGSQTG